MYRSNDSKLPIIPDIAIDNLTHYALENSLRRIPQNTTLVEEIKQFFPIPEGSPIQSGFVELKNGTVGFVFHAMCVND